MLPLAAVAGGPLQGAGVLAAFGLGTLPGLVLAGAAARWFAHARRQPHVRRLAAVLGIQYKQLEDREFSHASALVLLDAEGRIVARSDRLGEADPEFVAALRRVLDASAR